MRKIATISLLCATLCVQYSHAETVDTFGGRDGSSQTIAHCGLLPTTADRYTTSIVAVRMIQQKLAGLGYYRGVASGFYDPPSVAAVKRFQKDYGIPVTGVVGPETASRLAYETHPSANVRRCFRTADLRAR